MPRKRKEEEVVEDEANQADNGLEADEDEELDEAGFHVADEEEGEDFQEEGDEKSLDSEEDVEYVGSPKKGRRRTGSGLLDEYEDHLDDEEEEDEDLEEDDLDDEEEDWDDEDGDGDDEDEE
jgi:hypothetical protein